MKCQILFSGENKKKLLTAEFALSVLSVNVVLILVYDFSDSLLRSNIRVYYLKFTRP